MFDVFWPLVGNIVCVAITIITSRLSTRVLKKALLKRDMATFLSIRAEDMQSSSSQTTQRQCARNRTAITALL